MLLVQKVAVNMLIQHLILCIYLWIIQISGNYGTGIITSILNMLVHSYDAAWRSICEDTMYTHKNSIFAIKVFFFFLSLQIDQTFTKTGLILFLPLGAKFHIPNNFNYPFCGTIKQCVKPDHI